MRRATKWLICAVCAVTMAAPGAALAVPGELVINGGFETGSLSPWAPSNALVRGYNANGQRYAEGTNTGNYAAFFGNSHVSTISQTIATVAGQSYTFSFYTASDGGIQNELKATFGTTVVYDAVNAPASGYVLQAFSVVATDANTVISFGGRDDPGFLALDDVSVTVPEPATLALLGGGVLVIGALRRRQG